MAFEPSQADHAPAQGFAVTIPLRQAKTIKGFAMGTSALASTDVASLVSGIRVHRNGELLAEGRASKGVHMALANRNIVEPQAQRLNEEMVRFTWDASQHPMVMIRNEKGEVIAFARGGSIELPTDSKTLDIQFSDAVTSIGQTVQVK